MLVLLRLLLFGISTVGTFELIRKVSGDEVNIYFLPSLTVAIQVSVLFMAGLLNLLPETAYGLYLVGFAGFVYSVYKNKNLTFLKSYFNPGYILMLALFLLFAVYLRGKVFTYTDNFTHWGLVVKTMLQTNRYPNFKDTLIEFQEYPLGSSSYIYYFAKFIKTTESFQMLAQSYMLLAAFLPLFSFATKNLLAVSAVIFSFANYVLLYNIKITNLLVDTLLPLVGICGLLFVYQHCKESRKIMLCFAACYMVQLMQIKNSGIFFVVFIAIYLLSLPNKHHIYIYRGICIAVPFISLLLWHKHCKYVFNSAVTSKHAMTIENFTSVFRKKSQEDIAAICTSFLKFSVSNKELWITVGICALIGALILITRREFRKDFRKIAAISLVIYVTYMIGVLGVYLFSMQRYEAFGLYSVTRYTKTILIAILYLNIVPAVMLISGLSGKRLMMAAATGCIFVSFFAGMYISSGSIATVLQNDESHWAVKRNWVEKARKKYSVPMGSSYCFLTPSKDAQYTYHMYYMGRYIFQAEVTATVIESEDDFNGIFQEYVFVYDQDNEIIQDWIQKVYPEQVGNEVIIQPVAKNQ